MNECLGVLDALEAYLMEASKVPMTGKVLVDEGHVLDMLDKLRGSLRSHGQQARKMVDVESTSGVEDVLEGAESNEVNSSLKGSHEDKEVYLKLKKDAIEYAEYTLTHLNLMISKLQKNLISLERTVENGREILIKQCQDDSLEKEITYEPTGTT